MIERTVTRQAAQRFYDRLGRGHDLAELYESRAKARALDLLRLTPGLQILNAGAGTGKDQMAIVKALGTSDGVIGLDISPVMLKLVRHRTGSAVVSGDVLRLPFRDQSFDRILCAYVLDLIPTADLPRVLEEFKRALKPAGRMVLVSLTDGISPLSRLLISGWIKLYKLNPVLLGGCRPLRLAPWLQRAGFEIEANTVLVQLAVPSEVLAVTLK